MKRRIAITLLCVLILSACGRQSLPETTAPAAPNTVTVTFPEGTTAWQTAKRLEENGVCTAEAFLNAVSEAKADSDLFGEVDPLERPFIAEGYLFPDTYEFYIASSPDTALQKFLTNFAAKWTPEMDARAAELGMTRDEVITLASIVQAEAGYSEQMPHVSSVLHNRLSQNIRLQCDVTYFYLENTVMPFLCGEEWDDDVYEQYADRYYTYRFAGLPAGPMCDPGLDAIRAALYPADTDDLYFVTDALGNFFYAATHEQHIQNCEAAKAVQTTE